MKHEEPLLDLLFNRLTADAVPDETAEVVLAALAGEEDLAAALTGRQTKLDIQRAAEHEASPHIYLSSVTVAGFRGVGPERTLQFRDGPGLTLVVGRNGSGKSSFAEAVELSLTGDSARWADRNSIWRTGWRNLHHPHPCAITSELRFDGEPTPTKVQRSWQADGDLTDAQVTISTGKVRHASLADLGLARPLKLYRPFLTAADLGKLIAGTPSELFDAIYTIVGLDALADADKRLMTATRPLEAATKEVRTQRHSLASRIGGIDDDRARRAAVVLTKASPDLDQLDMILAEPLDDSSDTTIALCRTLRDLVLPEPAEITKLAQELNVASAETRLHDSSQSKASIRIAEMLRLALDHHTDIGDGPCPICRTGALDTTWRQTASATLSELKVTTHGGQPTASPGLNAEPAPLSLASPCSSAICRTRRPVTLQFPPSRTALRGCKTCRPPLMIWHSI